MSNDGNGKSVSTGLAWIAAVSLALAGHAIWWVWLSGTEPELQTRKPGAPAISIWRLPPAGEFGNDSVEDPLSVWSPVLFALPSPSGFSRAAMTGGSGLRPPIQAPVDVSAPLSKPVFVRGDKPAIVLARRPESLSQYDRSPALPLSHPPAFAPAATAGEQVVRVEFTGGLREEFFETLTLPKDVLTAESATWSVEIFLSTDDLGIVQTVLLEKRAGNELINRSVARAVYGWRIYQERAPMSGRLKIYTVKSTPQ